MNSKKQSVFKEESVKNDSEKRKSVTQTNSGLEENIAGALCYLAWAITGIIFLVIEKENNFIRFHALQAVITSVAIFIITIVISLIPVIGLIFSILLTPVILLLWLFMMWKAYQGERFKLPFVGDMVEKQLNN